MQILTPDELRTALSYDPQEKYLGRFNDKQEAHAAYLAAKRELHEGCTL